MSWSCPRTSGRTAQTGWWSRKLPPHHVAPEFEPMETTRNGVQRCRAGRREGFIDALLEGSRSRNSSPSMTPEATGGSDGYSAYRTGRRRNCSVPWRQPGEAVGIMLETNQGGPL